MLELKNINKYYNPGTVNQMCLFNDFNFKVKHAIEFLNKKDKVKAYVHFKGREIAHKELGELLLFVLLPLSVLHVCVTPS